MRFLVDAQLPPALRGWLEARGHEAQAVAPGEKDEAVWVRARNEGWVILTKDRDFAVWVTARSAGPAVVWVRLGNATLAALVAWLEPLWPEVERRLAGGARLVELGRPQGALKLS